MSRHKEQLREINKAFAAHTSVTMKRTFPLYLYLQILDRRSVIGEAAIIRKKETIKLGPCVSKVVLDMLL